MLVGARRGGKERGELRVEIAQELEVEGEGGRPRRALPAVLDQRRQEPRQDDDHEIVAQAHALGLRGRLALGDLEDQRPVGDQQLGQLGPRRRGRVGAGPRRHLDPLARRRVEEAEVVHHEERQLDAEAREVAPPPHGAQRQHRRARPNEGEEQPAERAHDGRIGFKRGRDGHGARAAAHCHLSPLVGASVGLSPLIEFRSGLVLSCLTQCHWPTLLESASEYCPSSSGRALAHLVDEHALALDVRVRTDGAVLMLLPLEVHHVALGGAAELTPVARIGALPATDHVVALVDHVEIAVDGVVVDARPRLAGRQLARLDVAELGRGAAAASRQRAARGRQRNRHSHAAQPCRSSHGRECYHQRAAVEARTKSRSAARPRRMRRGLHTGLRPRVHVERAALPFRAGSM